MVRLAVCQYLGSLLMSDLGRLNAEGPCIDRWLRHWLPTWLQMILQLHKDITVCRTRWQPAKASASKDVSLYPQSGCCSHRQANPHEGCWWRSWYPVGQGCLKEVDPCTCSSALQGSRNREKAILQQSL